MTSASDHLANERTFLAWVRTGIALIGFGFVIAKFAIFLDLIKASKNVPISSSVTYGEVLIFMGAVTIVYGLYSYIEIEKDLKRGEYRSRDLQNAVFAGSIIVVAIVMSLLLL